MLVDEDRVSVGVQHHEVRWAGRALVRLARWLGGGDWREPPALHRLFESVDAPRDDTGVGPAPPETVALWVELVASMGPDELADLEARTFNQWNRASLSALGIAIDRRRKELAR